MLLSPIKISPLSINSFDSLTSNCSYYFDDTDNYATIGSHVNSTIEGAATFSIRVVFRLIDIANNNWILSNATASNNSLRIQYDQ